MNGISAIIGFLLLIATIIKCQTPEDCKNRRSQCIGENNCLSCIRAHHCCHWCFQEDFSGYRCNVDQSDSNVPICNSTFLLKNSKTRAVVVSNPNFADVKNEILEAIQFRPKEFTLDLRIGEPINISIQYQPAKNFPLDLYYLMDLTKSMEPDLNTLQTLGFNLTKTLQELTQNYKIAFGSYIDKPTMPFYFTDAEQAANPCKLNKETCKPGYLFKHSLNFTNKVDDFIEEVKRSNVSANLDNLEGGMDAVMQLLLCGKEVGWTANARKLILVATEGMMHFAGDGILAGSSKRNRELCLIDGSGVYRNSLLYDYPSLEEIHHELRIKKTNIIFASKINSINYYNTLHKVLNEASFVGELQRDSTNVLHLVEKGYYAFIKQVNLFVNTSHIDGLNVEYFADCYGDKKWKKSSSCNNAEEGKSINFKLQFLLEKPQDIDEDTVFVEESNLNENVRINLKFLDSKCNCPLPRETPHCFHGVFDCQNCTCDYGWIGPQCNKECDTNLNNCRFEKNGVVSSTCSAKGDCICGKCHCYFPYIGTFCEYQCLVEKSTNLICGGHGKCVKGACECYENYSGSACDCYESNDGCAIPGTGQLCNEHGNCTCNQCHCQKGYSGNLCEVCENCQGLCKNYEHLIIDYVIKEKKLEQNNIRIQIVEKVDEERLVCLYRYTNEDEIKCDVFFTYDIKIDNSVDIQSQKPLCSKPLGAFTSIGIVLAVIFGLGILGILIWKCRNMRLDRIEYEEFYKRTQEAFSKREENPLYKSPVTTYRNPMELVQIHKKNE